MRVIDPHDPRPLRGAPVATFDFETTGPDPATAVPVQFAVAWCDLGDTEPEIGLSMLINPGVPIPEGAAAVHGITDDMVADAPTWPEALPLLLQALEGRVLAAYNLPYDWQILARGIADAGLAADEVPFGALDPLVWAKVVHRYDKGKRLVDTAARYGIEVDAHDAAGDALATAKLMPRLLHALGRHRECGPDPLRSVGAMWAWTRDTGVREENGFAAWCARQGRPEPTRPWRLLTGAG